MGLPAKGAFRLSFLMSVPAILGAAILEAAPVLLDPAPAMPSGWIVAACAAFLVGYIALASLRRLVLSGRWAYFGVYCFCLGSVAVVSGIWK
jgi:undecaprenyl-diphosphatase